MACFNKDLHQGNIYHNTRRKAQSSGQKFRIEFREKKDMMLPTPVARPAKIVNPSANKIELVSIFPPIGFNL
jgi:hypothetical protein